MSGFTALVIGATGATGTELVQQLMDDNQYTSVIVFSRRPLLVTNAKLTTHIVDFDNPQAWAHLVKGDVLFSALATTLKQAGSQQEQYKIDYTYQYQTAATAAANGVAKYVLVSAMGANAKSWLFYPRIKGELDNAASTLPFKQIHIFRPGFLLRQPDKIRPMEKLGIAIIQFFNKLGLFKSQMPLPVEVLAQKMRSVLLNPDAQQFQIYSLDSIFDL
ncbi:MAG: hypothetical protein RJA53_306 [Bacteroidota bacterium]|jgi:uncharacterized protein YbjT (DUF2867 family)